MKGGNAREYSNPIASSREVVRRESMSFSRWYNTFRRVQIEEGDDEKFVERKEPGQNSPPSVHSALISSCSSSTSTARGNNPGRCMKVEGGRAF